MKKWYHIYNLNKDEKNLICGYCYIEQILFEVSAEADTYNISFYLDKSQHYKLQRYIDIIFI